MVEPIFLEFLAFCKFEGLQRESNASLCPKEQTVLGFHSSSKCVLKFIVDLLDSSMKVDSQI